MDGDIARCVAQRTGRVAAGEGCRVQQEHQMILMGVAVDCDQWAHAVAFPTGAGFRVPLIVLARL